MKISMMLNYSGGFRESVDRVVELEKAGLDQVLIPEAYSFDAISQVGFLAAKTSTVEIGTGIINVFSRSAALVAMTAAGCDYVSEGRFLLGLGASGPQVIEGFHGVPYEKPMQRIKEYVEACRLILKRAEPFNYQGQTFQAPLPAGQGTGNAKALKIINHPVRSEIPIWWASLMGRSVEATAEIADGWLPIMFIPEKFRRVWGSALDAGLAKRDAARGPLQISAGGMLAIDEKLTGEAQTAVLDHDRAHMALYVGGMGRAARTSTTTFAEPMAMRRRRSRYKITTSMAVGLRPRLRCLPNGLSCRISLGPPATSRNESLPTVRQVSPCCR